MKLNKLFVLPGMLLLPLLSACVTSEQNQLIQGPVLTKETARNRVPFCQVAKPLPPVPGDPGPTQIQKAGHNATGSYLCKWIGTTSQ